MLPVKREPRPRFTGNIIFPSNRDRSAIITAYPFV